MKEIMTSDIDIVHFKYSEICIQNKVRHINQPVVFRKLSVEERQMFVEMNPMYKNELERFAVSDSLPKYYGMKVGDIVHCEDNDRQTGLDKKYALIVNGIP